MTKFKCICLLLILGTPVCLLRAQTKDTVYTSKDCWSWKHEDDMKLSSSNVIYPTFYTLPDGKWHIWYKDDTRGSITMTGESAILKDWTLGEKPAIGGKPHEGPKIFFFNNLYWMITDEWAG